MDTSASGGMAPALQSTNHQSTDLVKAESHTNGVKEVFPQETINGNVFDEEVGVIDKKLPATINHSGVRKLMPNGLSSGDGSQFTDNHSEQSMTVKESFNLSKKKELKSTVATFHVGQGDCSVSHHNGWGNHKKGLISGVLQENNSTILNTLQNGKDLLEKEKPSNTSFRSPATDNIMPYKSTCCKGVNENSPNGQIESGSYVLSPENIPKGSSTVDISLLIPEDTLETSATAIESVKSINKKSKCSETNYLSTHYPMDMVSESSVSLSAYQRASNDGHTNSKTKFDICSPNSGVQKCLETTSMNPQQTCISLASELPQALKYTDFSNSDLLKLKEQVPNLSHKLAHTLQELAASLKGTALPSESVTQKNEVGHQEYRHTVTNASEKERHKSVKSLDFTFNISPSQADTISESEKILLDSKLKSAVKSSHALQKRLIMLSKKINCIRINKVGKYVKRELHTMVQNGCQSVAETEDPSKSSGRAHWWISNLHAPGEQECQLKQKDLSKSLWQQVLTKRCQKGGDNIIPIQSCVSTHENSNKGKIVTYSQLQRGNFLVEKDVGSPVVGGINLDPIVQLTRVESEPLRGRVWIEMLDKARTFHGILMKELNFLLSRLDSDLTDSSSDEESAKSAYKRVSKVKSSANNKFQKSFCKWVAERAEISKKWAWLQSRISILEFSIREQGEIYRQLRGAKGDVKLDEASQLPDGSCQNQLTPKNNSVYFLRRPEDSSIVSTSPSCYVNQLLNNVRYQTSRLFDTLSPLSCGTPSPSQPFTESPEMLDIESRRRVELSGRVQEKLTTSARTRPLIRSIFRRRKLIKLEEIGRKSEKVLLLATVPNDNAIMCTKNVKPCQNDACDSFALKAAMHDHSYHAVISSTKEIPLSMPMQAVMKSNRKWCRRPEASGSYLKDSESKDKQKRHNKNSKQKSRKRKEKRPAKSLHNQNLEDPIESKKRRLSSMTSESGRRRQRVLSFDSDLESSLVISGFPNYQGSRGSNSGTSTPTHENMAYHANMKKKKSSEQAYDINNIVIPHGLTSARIEKLAYKEIQTPSWKLIEARSLKSCEKAENPESGLETEDISQTAYKTRHDRYEIMEKRKYMAYMEWSISRRGRGSRMSSAGIPVNSDSISPASPTFNPGPLNYVGDQPSTSTQNSDIDMLCSKQKPGMQLENSPPSPTATPGVRTRRMSSDQGRATTHLHHLHGLNHNISTSIQGHSSPSGQDRLGAVRSSFEPPVASAVNARSISDNVINPSIIQLENTLSWESRQFPLQEEDVIMLENIDYTLQKMHRQNSEFNRLDDDDVNSDNDVSKTFRPVSRQGSAEGQRTPNESHPRILSVEALHDHQLMQHSKIGKRRRTDSRASSLAAPDDPGRHSDASNASASSLHRKRRIGQSWKFVGGQRREFTGRSCMSRRQHRSYLKLRLSESDSTDIDSDDSHSTSNTSTSCDDAGHMVDDFADPEWDARSTRIRL